MAGKVTDSANSMFASIGAVQTLVENFPMNLISFKNFKFSTSFDVISILFKILGVSREEVIEVLTNALAPSNNDENGGGFVAYAEEIVKLALEANISNILNCSTNPIISNNLLDTYYTGDGLEKSGNGITLNVAEVDFTGVLNRNPFYETDSKFYFDVDEYNANTIWKSKDFNAFLWYIINKSDKTQTDERTWTNRYRAAMWGEGNGKTKEIIKCTYIDEEYPNTDKLRVQICGARKDGEKLKPANYFKTRKLSKKDGTEWALNKTIFEFNHEFLTSIKLYDPKVIIAEIVEYLFGEGNLSVNLGFSLNEEIIQGKIQEIIRKVIEADDLEVNDCFFSFSNEEYNDMLEKAEQNRYNMHTNGNGFYETDTQDILNQLTGITSSNTLIENKAVISKTLNDIIATPAQDPSSTVSLGVSFDWEFELMRMLVYPFIRPLFTPKVIFLLMVNKKIMGSLDDTKNIDFNTIVDDLMNGLFFIIKDIIVKLKDMLVDIFLSWILKKLAPLLALFAARLLLEALTMYKDLLFEIFNACRLSIWNSFNFGNNISGVLDDVNYADIHPSEITQTEPGQKLC
jgi:hypothetical protein